MTGIRRQRTEDRGQTSPAAHPCSGGALRSGRYKRSILAALCLLSSVLCPLAASAEGISVNKAELRLGDDGYHLIASYDIHLTFVVQQALERGIPLYFVAEFSMTRPRWYWLEEEIFLGEQTAKLSYNVLTRQYRISRGALFQNFVSFEDALNMLSRQSSAAIPVDLIKPDSGYIAGLIKKVTSESSYFAAVRLRLDTDQLPRLLQVNALTGADWTLNSNWYRWVIRPEEMAIRSEIKAE